MAGKPATIRNADGSTFRATTQNGIMGTLVRVRHSAIGTAGGDILWDAPYGTRLHYLPGGGQMVPITNDRYRSAATRAEAVRKALAFFGESYADTLKHAAAEGIDVRECFRAE